VQIHLGLTAALVQLLSASVSSPRDLGCPREKRKIRSTRRTIDRSIPSKETDRKYDVEIANALQSNGKKSRSKKKLIGVCKKWIWTWTNWKKLEQIEEIDNHQVCCLVSVSPIRIDPVWGRLPNRNVQEQNMRQDAWYPTQSLTGFHFIL
jgi:hypothetical protein